VEFTGELHPARAVIASNRKMVMVLMFLYLS